MSEAIAIQTGEAWENLDAAAASRRAKNLAHQPTPSNRACTNGCPDTTPQSSRPIFSIHKSLVICMTWNVQPQLHVRSTAKVHSPRTRDISE